MMTPEDVAVLDAMQVGRQHLEDAGYAKTVDEDESDDSGTIEEQLAPWNITRNFINATQGKAMLALHGEGDPTGRGEGISFLRTSMKGGFRPIGESVNDKLDKPKRTYNLAAQQKIYDEEIRKIWDAQARSLSLTNTDDISWEDDQHARERDSTTAGSHHESPHVGDEEDDISVFSHASGRSRQSKILRITRLVRDHNGVLQRDVEIVRDPNVIRAYVKRRQELEDEKLAYVAVQQIDKKLILTPGQRTFR
jgi:transcription initiation factor TFIID subunit 1